MRLYQIDAFTDKLFSGNPAAVVPLDYWIDDELMQNIAMENNLSETAFICPSFSASEVSPIGGDLEGADFDIRWFTPTSEMDLCGHATLASAYVLFNIMDFHKEVITLSCKSCELKVWKESDAIWMDFPSWKPERFNDYPAGLSEALGGAEIVGVYKHRDLLVELMNEEAVRKCNPDFTLINKTGYKIIITAAGKEVDFVSRFFAPTVGVNEDPVTGSAHSQLIPFWADKLGNDSLVAHQLSHRGGKIICKQKGDRVIIGGNCVFYMSGEIEI
ncbi:MAG TPA: PhzF family phenazine biosynthesis protein [Chitinophagaceae bacterium]|nr:PhzF family phenazine biosynthesis protein [Chitinophagaceae bacterium]